ncbi:ribosome recycling factor family protein [Pseudoalteromonas sp. MMG024]|uniref:ribosome recycling factor family protein n=1 Tax=Pseudoalteromonas sp. MMG024 TaxID=2909980 RepID=UPI001F33C51F|nr:ribosome recycling factor family protein [Pseudoalteromonas sp. MMG024]MCF6455870.1 ribosome recycling factor family protein [Pseudoalteromonas sp. MMG024]
MLEIQLNSFVRRIARANELKTLIKASGANLTRKGRSRNWQLQGEWHQFALIIELAETQNEPSWLWVITQLKSVKPKPSASELIEIVRQNPTITLTQLMAKTDCTLIEGRQALDSLAFD